MKIKQLAAVAILMIAALIIAIISGGDGVAHDKDTVTVGIAYSEGYKITSQNPVTVLRGEPISFDIEVLDGYVFRSAEGFTYADGKLILDSAKTSKSVYPEMGKHCSVTLSHTGSGTVELLTDPTVLDGESASVKIVPDENYVIERITVGGKEYPIPADDTLTFTVADHTEVSVEFSGKSVTFMAMSGNLGSAFVENSTDDYRYGDILNLNCTFDTEHIIFNGWSAGAYLSEGGKLISADPAYSYTITENTVLYANFTDRSTYQIKYNANYGTQLKNIDGEFSPGEYVNLAVDDGAFVREGYSLVSFNTRSDGTGTRYSLGAMIEMPREDVTLFAEWVKETDPAYLTYTADGGEITVTGLSDAGRAAGITKLTLPKYIGGMPVTSIAYRAFADNTDLVRVIIPVGVTTVGNGAFANCTSITIAYFPETVTYMAENAMSGCTSFTDMRVIACLGRAFDYDYDSAMADKYMRLVNTEGKRIILVGGSSLAFGLNSGMIKEKYPDYTVINFSCSAFYGILPLFDMLKEHVREGDIVIFAPEYYSTMYAYTEEASMNNWQYLESNYDILADINIQNNQYIFRKFTEYLNLKRAYLPGKKVNADNVYIRSGFNQAGDLTVYRPNQGFFGFAAPQEWVITDVGMARYNELCKLLTERGATCLFSFPPQPSGGGSRDYIAGATAGFEARLRGALNADYCKIISSVADYYFDDKLFYDNTYHLTLEGADVRTEQLLRDLGAHLGN